MAHDTGKAGGQVSQETEGEIIIDGQHKTYEVVYKGRSYGHFSTEQGAKSWLKSVKEEDELING